LFERKDKYYMIVFLHFTRKRLMVMSEKPNILFILIDDMGWRDLSCYGSTFYETPNIDKLSIEGMKFTDAYAACPVCSPTRASILSGKYPANVGVTDWIDHNKNYHPCRGKLIDAPYIDHLPLNEKSLARALKESGYLTWHIGKWHLGNEPYYPDKHGFDVNIGGCYMGSPAKEGYFSPWNIPTLENGPEGEYLTDRLTDEAIRLIEAHAHEGHPFFLNMWYYSVHIPIQAKEDKIKKYQEKRFRLELKEGDEFQEGDFFPAEHKKDLKIKRRLIQADPAYAAMIESLDENIGRLLDTLQKNGLDENTIVIFTSDNGGLSTAEGSPTCNSPLNEGKGWMYEGGVREPLLIKWPKVIKGGSECSAYVTSPDFYPTLLEAAKLDFIPEQHEDGMSFMPLLQGNVDFDRGAVYWHYPHYGNQGSTPGSSIRLGDFKLIEFFEDERVELYNLRDDIEEKKDLSEELPDMVKEMKRMLTQWRKKIEAKLPKINSDYAPR